MKHIVLEMDIDESGNVFDSKLTVGGEKDRIAGTGTT